MPFQFGILFVPPTLFMLSRGMVVMLCWLDWLSFKGLSNALDTVASDLRSTKMVSANGAISMDWSFPWYSNISFVRYPPLNSILFDSLLSNVGCPLDCDQLSSPFEWDHVETVTIWMGEEGALKCYSLYGIIKTVPSSLIWSMKELRVGQSQGWCVNHNLFCSRDVSDMCCQATTRIRDLEAIVMATVKMVKIVLRVSWPSWGSSWWGRFRFILLQEKGRIV